MSVLLIGEFTTLGALFSDFVGTEPYTGIVLVAVLTMAYSASGGGGWRCQSSRTASRPSPSPVSGFASAVLLPGDLSATLGATHPRSGRGRGHNWCRALSLRFQLGD
eukprot:RCo043632